MNRALIVAALLLFLAIGSSNAAGAAPLAQSQISFTFINGHIVVPVRDGNGHTLHLLMGMATDYSSLATPAAKAAGVPLGPYISRKTGKVIPGVFKGHVSGLLLGDYALPNSKYVVSGGWDAYSKNLGVVVDGDLSYNEFQGHLLQFDFVRKVIRVMGDPPRLADTSVPLSVTLYNADFEHVLTFPIAVGGKSMTAEFDSLGEAPFALLPPAADLGQPLGAGVPISTWALGTQLVPSKCVDVALGDVHFACVATVIAGGKLRRSDTIGISVGSKFWEHGIVTLDLKGYRLYYSTAT